MAVSQTAAADAAADAGDPPPADYFLADNYNNSYLTMLSESGLIFGVINIVGNFGTVFVDQVRVFHLSLLGTLCSSLLELPL